MSSSMVITLKPATDLTADEIADCYALVARTGFSVEPGYLESAHLTHNPTMVLAHQNGRLVGLQSYSLYRCKTPFRRRAMPVLYGGLAFQDTTAVGRGIAHQLSVSYMRHAFGPFWPLRSYAFMLRTPNPKLMQIMGLQHKLYLPTSNELTQTLIRFAREFAQKERGIRYTIDDRLVVLTPDEERTPTEITNQWPMFYRASQESFNQLAFDLKLIVQEDGRQYLTDNYLLVLGRSSRSQLLKAVWKLSWRWLGKRLGIGSQPLSPGLGEGPGVRATRPVQA
ncbi:hypothetical protein [Spirosoma migulaei]